MKSILRDPVFWAFMGCFVTAVALGIKAWHKKKSLSFPWKMLSIGLDML